ncbi:MAG: diaminopimelate decarboxylase [Desulfobacterales bacterium]|nr:diaminopimelate decarboxylase [Desulfobacterales bacterium]
MKLENNPYTIQGVDVHTVCREFGTPLYVYDADHIAGQVRYFKSAFSGVPAKIKYACKACSNINILKLMKKLGTGLDTVSPAEIQLGLAAGFKPGEIVFTPNCVDFAEIEQAVTTGTAINIESISSLEKFARRYGGSVPICIRLNPNISSQVNADQVDWWHNQSKFGISLSQLATVKALETTHGLRINGVHIHSSSVIMSPEVFTEGARTVFDIAATFEHLEFVDFGGGIKVDAGDGHPVIDLGEIGKALEHLYTDFCTKLGRKIEIWFEPGRFLIGNAGTLLAECTVVKHNEAVDFVGLNTGFNHLIRPMFYDAFHEIVNASNPDGKPQKYSVVGNLCEIDNLGQDRVLPEVREKDLIAIKSTGAYGFSMASSYNSRPRPAEVLVINGKAHLIRKRETYADMVKNIVEINL